MCGGPFVSPVSRVPRRGRRGDGLPLGCHWSSATSVFRRRTIGATPGDPAVPDGTGRRRPVAPRKGGQCHPTCPGGVEPDPGPLADEVPLELGQGGEDVEDELAAAGRRVDALPEAAEPDTPVAEGSEGLDQVAERPAEAVELPDDDRVPPVGEGQGLPQAHPRGAGPVGGVGEDPLAAGLGQGVVLEVEFLVGGRDAGVADEHGPLRGLIVPEPAPRVKLRDLWFRDEKRDGLLASCGRFTCMRPTVPFSAVSETRRAGAT
jgi:hypothetical protein